MAAHAMAKGPMSLLLASSGAQWAVLGSIVYGCLYPEFASNLVKPWIKHFSDTDYVNAATRQIVIHTTTSDGRRSLLTTIVTYVVGAGCVWASFSMLVTFLPEHLQNMLPVTKKVFETATGKLAMGICNVKEVLGKQLIALYKKQDDLGKKQDETIIQVRSVKDELTETRTDIGNLNLTVSRCETSLDESSRLQSYTARGVKLLVRSVASILPGDDRISRELDQYAHDGDMFRKQFDMSSSSIRSKSTGVLPSPRNPHRVVVTPSTKLELKHGDPEHELPEDPSMESDAPSYSMETKEAINDMLALIRSGRLSVN